MKRILHGIARAFGIAGRATVALIGIAGITAAVANYAATQGSGTNFGSVVVSTVHYAQQLLCDVTTPSQCAAVSAAGAVKTDASATTQPVSGTVTANAGTNLNTSTLSTSANQTSELTKLDSIITNTGAPIPAGSSTIGNTIPAPTGSSSLALTDVACGSAVSSCVLKASAGNFYGVYAECTAACWLMVFNSASAPSNGATTAGKASGNMVECISLTGTAGGGKSINYPTFPIPYSVGITAVISSTACASLTLSTVGFIHGSVL